MCIHGDFVIDTWMPESFISDNCKLEDTKEEEE